ncbi:hypothetical protein [Sulfolobus super-elliptical virus]|nr:hypothetical protein [Sulfolobus super-elliptical virus]
MKSGGQMREKGVILNKGGIILIKIYEKGRITEGELIKETKFSAGTVLRWKEKLREKGYINVIKEKNKVYIELTEKGNDLAKKLLTIEQKLEEALQ